MANKLPWFTHDHNARCDEFIQRLMDEFGHFGYAAYFMLLEVIHEHGVGGALTMKQTRLAHNLRTRWPQLRVLLEFCRSSAKVDVNFTADEVQLLNKKFIERQRKSKSNAPAMLQQCSGNPGIEGEREREVPPISPRGGLGNRDGFDQFWDTYPKKVGKEAARKIWKRLKPDRNLQAQIINAVRVQLSCDQWVRDGGQYIPHPSTWLNAGRWSDEVTPGSHDHASEPAVLRVDRGAV